LAQVKCYWCEVKDEKDLMIREENKKHYHKDKCHAAFLADREFKRVEREKQTMLAHKIAEIYGLESIQLIPRQIYPRIEDIRNDSVLFGKLGKNYKQGIPYEGIAYTFEYCKGKIRECENNPNLKFESLLQKMVYGLAIVRNNIVNARDHAAKIAKQKQSTVKIIEKIDDMSDVRDRIKQAQSKNKRNENDDKPDLTTLLD
jgi:hypothetical protein